MIVKKRRQSTNVIDARDGGAKTKNDLVIGHSRQIFNKPLSDKLTKVKNSMANADRLNNKGAGAKASRSPGKVDFFSSKFKKKGK